MEKYIYDPAKLPKPVYRENPRWEALYYKAWELAFQNVEYIENPGWKPQLTCMPGVNTVWQWDSCFMVFITNYAAGTISALNNLDNLYRLRRESDGYMSMAYRISTEQPAFGERINPPLMAWAEWESYRITQDKQRLARVLPALEGMYGFIENNRRRGPGLYWFEDPGSSGMDNSPRGAFGTPSLDGNCLCHIDLGCQQSLSAKCLSDICTALGDGEKADFYRRENNRINDLINRYHWNEKGGFYYDFFTRSNPEDKVKHIPCKTAAAFWTILCGAAQGERLQKVVEKMFDPTLFYGKVPFATLSADDLNYDPTGGYWLGGVWAPTNYAAIRGLWENGYPEQARQAAMDYLTAIDKVEADPDFGTIWECYSPEAYKPATAEAGEWVRPDFVGWSGLAPITMLIENIIGLSFDVPQKTVTFRLHPGGDYGLENMPFDGGYVSVLCEACSKAPEKSRILVKTDRDMTLRLEGKHLKTPLVYHLKPGTHNIVF